MELTRYPDLRRLDDWKERLRLLVNQRRRMPYHYGTNDCWCFAQLSIAAVTGVTILAEIENPKTMMSAAKIMIAHGWDNVEGVMTACLGPPIEARLAGQGDILSFSMAGELHLALRISTTALSPAADGLQEVSSDKWRLAWRVG